MERVAKATAAAQTESAEVVDETVQTSFDAPAWKAQVPEPAWKAQVRRHSEEEKEAEAEAEAGSQRMSTPEAKMALVQELAQELVEEGQAAPSKEEELDSDDDEEEDDDEDENEAAMVEAMRAALAAHESKGDFEEDDEEVVMEREEDALQKKANELFRKTYGRNLNDPDDEEDEDSGEEAYELDDDLDYNGGVEAVAALAEPWLETIEENPAEEAEVEEDPPSRALTQEDEVLVESGSDSMGVDDEEEEEEEASYGGKGWPTESESPIGSWRKAREAERVIERAEAEVVVQMKEITAEERAALVEAAEEAAAEMMAAELTSPELTPPRSRRRSARRRAPPLQHYDLAPRLVGRRPPRASRGSLHATQSPSRCLLPLRVIKPPTPEPASPAPRSFAEARAMGEAAMSVGQSPCGSPPFSPPTSTMKSPHVKPLYATTTTTTQEEVVPPEGALCSTGRLLHGFGREPSEYLHRRQGVAWRAGRAAVRPLFGQ